MDKEDRQAIKRLDKIDDSLSEINKTLSSMDKTLAINTQHLSEHIRRTELLESQILPISRHVAQMQGAGKLLVYASLIATIATAIIMLR
jgi:hypothetical protein